MRRTEEQPSVVAAVADAIGSTEARAAKLIRVIRDEIDHWVLDGGSVFIPPFSLAFETDEVAQRFADAYGAASDEQLDAWYVGDAVVTSEWLGVPLERYDERPVASEILIAVGVAHRMGIADDDPRANAVTQEILDAAIAWAATFESGKRYQVSAVGLERDFEAWLVANIDALREIGYPVELVRQQPRFGDRRQADLLCRFIEDTKHEAKGDLLVVELKAIGGYRGAIDQLSGYVEATRDEIAEPGQAVHGLLIADGVSPGTDAYAREHGFEAHPLARLGYRRELARSAAESLTLPPLDPQQLRDVRARPQS